MSNEAKVTSVISPQAAQVPLTPYQALLEKFFDADKKADASTAEVAGFLIKMGDENPAIKRHWLLKSTRTGKKEAQQYFEWARDTAKDMATKRGEKNPNQKWKRIHDKAKELAGFEKSGSGGTKTEFDFVREFARGLQNHLFKTGEGQCHATKDLWERMQEAFTEDGLLKEDE